MATTIVLKNSVTTTNTPSSLAQGEVAINVTDKKVWVGNAATTPVQIVNGGPDGVFTSVTDSGLTINRLTYAGTGGLLKDSANIVTDGSKITTSTGFVGGPWTTATRPASPATGQEGFNTTLGTIEFYNGTAWASSSVAVPSVTTYTSSSGTYTTPSGAKYLFVQLVGGGGGGGASTGSAGGAGGNTTFGTSLLTANGGSGGNSGASVGGFGGAGGSASGGDINVTGNSGSPGANVGTNGSANQAQPSGGTGGGSTFGGAGSGGLPSAAGSAAGGYGSGGGGGGSTQNAANAAGGGGASGYCQKIISSPSATYSYAVGAAGTGAAAGTSAGGAGSAGLILVTAYF